MHKSYEEFVLGLYGAMFVDIAERSPELHRECERDNKHLLSLVEHRGLPFLLVDLPAFGKHFDICLSNGRLTKSGIAGFSCYRARGPIPKLFKGLVLRVFDDNGCLRSDPDVASIRDVRQLCTAVKQLVVEAPDSSTWKQVNEFFQIEREIDRPSLCWDDGDFSSDDSSDLHLGDRRSHEPEHGDLFPESLYSPSARFAEPQCLRLVQSVADAVVAQFGRFDPSEWRFRHGPGAVSDLRNGYKYSFPHWPDKLERSFPVADFAFANFSDWADHVQSGGFSSTHLRGEPPARLAAVPKSYSGPRLIASEPVAHQWCQQSIASFLMRRVEETCLSSCISFRDQGPNQDFALRASRTASHSTIDLSSASDRISCWMIERLFRRSPSLLESFYSVRTRWIRQDIDKHNPKFSRLRKFSTMGSALTFPVQTISFAIIVIGCTLYVEGLPATYANIRHAARRVRVFGDDIIVPLHVHDCVVDTLTHLRLKVNPAKTFATGKFRESCGVDAYDGFNVSKVSVKRVPSVSSPEAVLSSLDVHNNLVQHGWYATARYVKRTVEALRRYAFPLKSPDSGAIGWSDLFGDYTCSLKRRWNTELHRPEVKATLPIGERKLTEVDSSAMMLQYFTEALKPPKSREKRLGEPSLRHPLKLRWVWAPVA